MLTFRFQGPAVNYLPVKFRTTHPAYDFTPWVISSLSPPPTGLHAFVCFAGSFRNACPVLPHPGKFHTFRKPQVTGCLLPAWDPLAQAAPSKYPILDLCHPVAPLASPFSGQTTYLPSRMKSLPSRTGVGNLWPHGFNMTLELMWSDSPKTTTAGKT